MRLSSSFARLSLLSDRSTTPPDSQKFRQWALDAANVSVVEGAGSFVTLFKKYALNSRWSVPGFESKNVCSAAYSQADFANLGAVAEIAIDLEAVADIRCPGADVESTRFIIETATRRRGLLQYAAEVVFAGIANVGGPVSLRNTTHGEKGSEQAGSR